MKDTKKIIHKLCEISDLLHTANEQQAVITFAANLNLIYGQAIQVDITSKELKFSGITFAERGVGKIIVNALNVSKC